MSDQLTDIQARVNQIYSELMGSDLSKRGGLIMSVQDLKVQMDMMNARITRLESDNATWKKIMYAAAFGLLVGAIIFGFMSLKEGLNIFK